MELAADDAPPPPVRATPWPPPAGASPAAVLGPEPSGAPRPPPAVPLHIVHFNDVYEICERDAEPVGGAPRFAHVVRRLRAAAAADGAPSLVLFSGDALSPSLIATMTRGSHMVSVLNELGVGAACLGNHDLDHGVEVFRSVGRRHAFPWLVSNATAAGRPLGDVTVTAAVAECGAGWRVGLIGLIEREWLDTLSTLPPGAVAFEDAGAAAARLAAALRGAGGCNLVVALTHMRLPNDRRLAAAAAAAASADLVLGGHDHEYCVELLAGGASRPVIKSGSDFRSLSLVRVSATGPLAAPTGGVGGVGDGAAAAAAASAAGSFLGAAIVAAPGRTPLHVDVTRHDVTRAEAEEPRMAAVVAGFADAVGRQLEAVVGVARTPLDARFAALRTSETALGDLVTDLMRAAMGADVALLNAGTLRADAVLGPGLLRARDLVALLPMQDSIVTLRMAGRSLRAALENAVCAWPAREGRFAQVSGIRFAFDPAQPPGRRVVRGSVKVLARRGPRAGAGGGGGGGGAAAALSGRDAAPRAAGGAAAHVATGDGGALPSLPSAALSPAQLRPPSPPPAAPPHPPASPPVPSSGDDDAESSGGSLSDVPETEDDEGAAAEAEGGSGGGGDGTVAEDATSEGRARGAGGGSHGGADGVGGGAAGITPGETAGYLVANANGPGALPSASPPRAPTTTTTSPPPPETARTPPRSPAAALPHAHGAHALEHAHHPLVAAVLSPAARTPALFHFSTGRTRHGYMTHAVTHAAGDGAAGLDGPAGGGGSGGGSGRGGSGGRPVLEAASAEEEDAWAPLLRAGAAGDVDSRGGGGDSNGCVLPGATAVVTDSSPAAGQRAPPGAFPPPAEYSPTLPPTADSGLRLAALPASPVAAVVAAVTGLEAASPTPPAPPPASLRRAESAPSVVQYLSDLAAAAALGSPAPEHGHAHAHALSGSRRRAGGGPSSAASAVDLSAMAAAAAAAASRVGGAAPPAPSPPLPDPRDYAVSPSTGAVRRRPDAGGGSSGGADAEGAVGFAPTDGGATPRRGLAPHRRSRGAAPAVWVALDDDAFYTVATKSYLARGRDGYAAFTGADVTALTSEENGPILPLLVRNHFRILAALSDARGGGGGGGGLDAAHPLSPAAAGSRLRPRAKGLRRVPWPSGAGAPGGESVDDGALERGGDDGDGVDDLVGYRPRRRTLLAVAPVLDGRIRIVGHADWDPTAPAVAAIRGGGVGPT